MSKPFVVLAIAGTMSTTAVAQQQPQQTAPATTATQPAKPQMVKKRVCQMLEDEDPYSRLGTRKICKTVEVPADPQNGATGTANNQQSSTPPQPNGR